MVAAFKVLMDATYLVKFATLSALCICPKAVTPFPTAPTTSPNPDVSFPISIRSGPIAAAAIPMPTASSWLDCDRPSNQAIAPWIAVTTFCIYGIRTFPIWIATPSNADFKSVRLPAKVSILTSAMRSAAPELPLIESVRLA